MKRMTNTRLVLGLVGLLLLGASTGRAVARTIDLLPDVAAASNKFAPSPGEGVERQRLTEVALNALLEEPVRAGDRITFRLFPDAELEGVIETVEEEGGRRTSIGGSIPGYPMSHFRLVVHNDVVIGNIQKDPHEGYELRLTPGGEPIVRQVTSHHPHGCAVTEAMIEEAYESAPPRIDSGNDKAKSGEPIDVFVFWTRAAQDSAGGRNAIKAIIRLAFIEARDANHISSISYDLLLAGFAYTDYEEGGNSYQTHLEGLQNPFDGAVNEMPQVRNDSGADIVSLFVHDTGACGIAYINGAWDENYAFNVVHWNCAAAVNSWSFAHELGHNMGSGHEVGDGGGITNYARGHKFTGNSGSVWRTIMVTNSVNSTRIQYFSNPTKIFDGQFTGVIVGQPGEADNHSVFANTAPTISNYTPMWPLEIWVDFNHVGFEFGTETDPFTSITEAIDDIHFGGTVRVRNSSPETITTEDKQVRLISWIGDAVIGK